MIFQPNQGYPRPKFAADFWYWLPDSRFFATPIMVSFTRVLNYRHSVCPRPFNGFNSYSFRPESSEASYFATPFFRTDWSMGVRLPMLVVFILHDDHSLQLCQICLSPITKTHQVSRSSMQGMLSLLIVSYRVVLKTCGIQICCFLFISDQRFKHLPKKYLNWHISKWSNSRQLQTCSVFKCQSQVLHVRFVLHL